MYFVKYFLKLLKSMNIFVYRNYILMYWEV